MPNRLALPAALLVAALALALAPTAAATPLASCSDRAFITVAGMAVFNDDNNGDGAIDCAISVTCPASSTSSCTYTVVGRVEGIGPGPSSVTLDYGQGLAGHPEIYPAGPSCTGPIVPLHAMCAYTDIQTVAPGVTLAVLCSASELHVTTAQYIALTCEIS